MNTYCVIGGTGFIGSSVVKELLAQSNKVVVLGRRPKKQTTLNRNTEYHQIDYANFAKSLGYIRKCDYLICLAYTSNPLVSFRDPISDIQNNLTPAVNLFKELSNSSIKKIVYISSGGAVYGITKKKAIVETDPTNPISPYGITKLAIEKYALLLHHTNKLPVVIVRPSNAYGPFQDPTRGQGFVATAMLKILRGQPVEIYGKSGSIRDYIYVTDTAKGIIAALRYGKPGEVYNLGTGIGITNRKILSYISQLVKQDGIIVKVNVLPRRKFDVPVNILDSNKLMDVSSWKNETSLIEGLRESWNWYKANISNFK